MHDTKAKLIVENGTICMLCEQDVGRHIEWHHIIPKCYYRRNGLAVNNDYANGVLLCHDCHKRIHKYDYDSYEYKQAMAKAVSNRNDKLGG